MNKDKQIIIDGVDVSGCSKFEWFCCRGICEEMYNCQYKQLKRKEQECEELKKIINEAKNSKLDLKSFLVGEAIQNEYEQQLDQLKADCERINLTNERLVQEKYDLHQDILKLKAENKELKEKINYLACSQNCYKYKQADKLKQTLRDIKEVANICLNQDVCAFCKYSDNCYMEDEEIPTYDICKLIIQKISEEANENN